jgi:hypothetical protein
MELKFVAAKKPVAIDATIRRRQRLVRRIDQQIALIQNVRDGMPPRTSWVWANDESKFFVHIKYGNKIIELRKGMFAIECETVEMAGKALEAVREMALNGEMDDQIAKMAREIRVSFMAGTK